MQAVPTPESKLVDRMKILVTKAVQSSNANAIQQLIKRGLSIDTPIMPGKVTPLLLCAAKGNTDCLQTILEHSDDVTQSDSTGKNAVHYACKAGNLENFIFLMDYFEKVAPQVIES